MFRSEALAQTAAAPARPAAKKPAPRAASRNATRSATRNATRNSTPSSRASNVAKVVAAGEGPTVQKILVKGNKKIETDAVIAKLATKQGQGISGEKLRQDLDVLFKTGFFYDVKIEREAVQGGVQLTYNVVEKPSVVEIVFAGNNEIDSTELQTTAAIKPYEVLNMGRIREAVEKIQKLYEDKGYFLARITPKVDPAGKDGLGEEAVKLTFEVQENDKVKVKRITILGNKQIADGKIKGLLQTQEGGFFQFHFVERIVQARRV
jgi:outer membrane protein insertion porin family